MLLFRSEASGNCLYSSVSLALVCNNMFVEELRILTSVELFLNANVYSKHPIFLSIFETPNDKLLSFNDLLPVCSSFESSASYCSPEKLVHNEAASNLQNRKWYNFLCMLALSSVVSGNIISYYPDCGDAELKLLFNCKIRPRKEILSMPDINILLFF